MPPKPDQPSQPAAQPMDMPVRGPKIIQPSQSFIEEMKATRLDLAAEPEPASPGATPPAATTSKPAVPAPTPTHQVEPLKSTAALPPTPAFTPRPTSAAASAPKESQPAAPAAHVLPTPPVGGAPSGPLAPNSGDGFIAGGFEPLAIQTAADTSNGSKLKSRKTLVLTAGVVALLIILGAGGFFGYSYYQKQQDAKKFNQLADKVTAQEIAGAQNYVKMAGAVDGVQDLMSVDDGSPSSISAISAKVKSLQSVADTACKAKGQDITASAIDTKSAGWKLSAEQRRYLTDWKKVLSGLQNSDYSNATICSDGDLIASVYREAVTWLPGLDLIGQIPDAPTADQMGILAQDSSQQFSLSDQAQIEKTLPATDKFLNDMQSFVTDYYNFWLAVQTQNSANIVKYSDLVQGLADKIDPEGTASDKETNNYMKKRDTAAIDASKTEITAIDYQKGPKTASGSHMQLDYALPAFRIADSTINNYNYNGDPDVTRYPHGDSISSLAKVDSDMQQLNKQGHLKGFSYTSLGSDDSGFNLSAKLANGTLLSEKVNPAPQTS